MRKLSVQEDVSPNLIPMIDIMFLLLLFFMLGADMGQRELEEVKLPTARAEEDKADTRLTINVAHGPPHCGLFNAGRVCREDSHWSLKIRGVEYKDSNVLVAHLKAQGDTPVMIRADAASPYGHAQRAMHACAEAGLYKISVGAAIRKS